MLAVISSSMAIANDENGNQLTGSGGNVQNLALVFAGHTYEIEQNSSSLAFRVDGPFGDVWGRFQEFSGEFIMLNNGVSEKTASIEINASSLDTSTGFINAILKGESFFDVEKFPSIRFYGHSIEWYSKTRAVLKGEMTIQNKTLPVAFYVELVDADGKYLDRITLKASTTIRRSEFGLHSLLPMVSDDVNIFMSADAVKKNAAASINSASTGSRYSFN